MKKQIFLFSLALSAVTLAGEVGTVSDVTVRQRWPWSPKVDIDFTVSGSGKTDVEITATWDGHPTPIALTAANGVTGRACGLADGAGHVVWDPREAGLTNALSGFKLTATAHAAADRTYLVCDLKTGAYEYFAAAPEGGWTNEVYRKEKMVYRRIDARTFIMGYTSAQRDACIAAGGPNGWAMNRNKAHTVTLSDDYYMAIFPTTFWQAYWLTSGKEMTSDDLDKWSSGYDYRPNVWRGSTNATSCIRWPDTRYKVAPGSMLDTLRRKFDKVFLFDFPTDAQWENAARNGTTTLWDFGNASANTSNGFNTAVAPYVDFSTAHVGKCRPNTYGIYDLYGKKNEMCLDAWQSEFPSSSTDPIGGNWTPKTTRVMRGYGIVNEAKIGYAVPTIRNDYEPDGYRSASYGNTTVRVCIHLNSVFD